jgi:hypothetical protein
LFCPKATLNTTIHTNNCKNLMFIIFCEACNIYFYNIQLQGSIMVLNLRSETD